MRRVENILKAHDAYGATFFEIGEHTPIAGIRQGIKVFQQHGCDVIVAVGGGSPVDGSKAILYNIQLETGGLTLKQIAIPTTLSAAEYSVRTQSQLLYPGRSDSILYRLVPDSPTMQERKLLSPLKI